MDADLARVLAGLRSWLKLAGDAAGLTDAQVIRADQPGPRPSLPYSTVKVLLYDQRVGADEEFVDASTPPVFTQRGNRTASVSINAYGAGASAWLRRAFGRLRHPSVKAVLSDAGLTVEPLGGLNNLTALVDDSMEPRFQRDVSVLYRTTSEAEAVVEAETIETTTTVTTPTGGADVVVTTTS